MTDKPNGRGIQFATVLHDYKKRPVLQDNAELTLGDLALVALDTAVNGADKEGLKPKLQRARLMDKIMDGLQNIQPIELTAEEIALIKDRIGQMVSSAYLARQVCLLIDPASDKEA